jgi:PAS domain S-box-containing protein
VIIVFYFIIKQFNREYAKRLKEIAHRKASQAALQKSEEKLQNLVNNAKVGVYQITKDGRFIMANNKFAHIFGYENLKEFLEEIENMSQLYAYPEKRSDVTNQLDSKGFIDRLPVELRNRDNEPIWVVFSARAYQVSEGDWIYEGFISDITDRKRIEAEKDRLITELEESMAQVKLLSGLLPICANCKKIRDDKGYWNQIEEFIGSHSEVQFSHGLCPDCLKELYPEYSDNILK